jgi:carboxypeptidase Taq
MLSQEVFKMSTSEEMAAFIAELSPKNKYEQLSEVARHTLEECKKEYERNKRIPAEEYKEYVVLQSKAESVWEEAKAEADFSLFRPYLEKLVEFNKRFINYWG